jgi:hypothetical protein
MKCLNCGKEISKIEGKREPKFCGSTCRSNYWQKQNRLKITKIVSAKIIKEDNKPIAKFVLEVEDNQKPIKQEGENSIDYAGRVNEWKKSLNK